VHLARLGNANSITAAYTTLKATAAPPCINGQVDGNATETSNIAAMTADIGCGGELIAQ